MPSLFICVSVRRSHLPDPSDKGDGVHLKMRHRTSYPKPFKAKVVQECLQPSVSMASVTLRQGINANLVRKWIPAFRDHRTLALPAFVPMNLAPATQPDQQMSVKIEVPFAYRSGAEDHDSRCTGSVQAARGSSPNRGRHRRVPAGGRELAGIHGPTDMLTDLATE
jgi:transposase